MTLEAANRLNIPVAILDKKSCPARQISSSSLHVEGNFTNAEDIRQLAAKCSVLTVEIEHVSVDALENISNEFSVSIRPSPKTIRLIQDKFIQKEFLLKNGISVGKFKSVENNKESIISAAEGPDGYGYPLMLKSRKLAYDGKGNAVIKSINDIDDALKQLGAKSDSSSFSSQLYVEKWAPFIMELAVMVVRGIDGVTTSYPVVQTIHKDNICLLVIAPAQIREDVANRARKLAEKAVSCFDTPGVFGVEMFLLNDGNILNHFLQ